MRRLKDFFGRSETLLGTYKLLKSFQQLFPKDALNFKKLSLFRKVFPYTQLSYSSLSNAYELAEDVERQGVAGAFVECGVWKGGCAGVLASVAARSGRKVWLFDSFEGMPEASAADEADATELAGGKFSGRLQAVGTNVAPVDIVKRLLFEKLRLDTDNILINKGWFQDTLPQARASIGPVAILRIDGDYYESTKVCLDTLYENVVAGGYVIIDDYATLKGCTKATDEFLQKNGISSKLERIPHGGAFFKRPV